MLLMIETFSVLSSQLEKLLIGRHNKSIETINRATQLNVSIINSIVVVVVVVFTLKAVPISTQYFLTSVLVQLMRTPSVVTG